MHVTTLAWSNDPIKLYLHFFFRCFFFHTEISSRMTDVEILLQKFQKTLTQLEKNLVFFTSSQKAVLTKYLDFLRNSRKKLKESSQQCQNKLHVARQPAYIIYNTIDAGAFILFLFTINISTIFTKKITNALVSAFRDWWQKQKTLNSLKIIIEEICQEYVIDKLAAKYSDRRSWSKTTNTHKRKTRNKKRGNMRIMTVNMLMLLIQGRKSTRPNLI